MSYRLRRLVTLGAAGIALMVCAFYIRARAVERQRIRNAVEEAERLTHHGKIDEAIAVLEHAVKVEPSYFEARETLAHYYLMTDRPAKGVALLEEGAKLFPKDSRIYLVLGSVHSVKPARDYDKAIFYLRKRIEIEPTDLYARNLLVRCYKWNGEPKKARREVVEILKLDPDNTAGLAASRTLGNDARKARTIGESQPGPN